MGLLTLMCSFVFDFGKFAMSETLGTLDNHVTPGLATLYRRWAEGKQPCPDESPLLSLLSTWKEVKTQRLRANG